MPRLINVRSGRARLCGGDPRCCGGVQDVGDTKKKRNKVVVGDDEEAEVDKDAAQVEQRIVRFVPKLFKDVAVRRVKVLRNVEK